ncbi:MAG: radical SAM protein [Halanaerobiales bacterium]|nr:radical SAM protein [Halanaerobiales bacterium]
MKYRPLRIVWELTNACNAKCIHCGSRSGSQREHELTKEEALKVCDELKELGCKHVTLIGGEFFLQHYWEAIVKRLLDNGIKVGPLTNGILLNDTNLQKLKNLGLKEVFISIDGIEKTHDHIRGVPGLFDKIIKNIKKAQEMGFVVGVNTSVSAINLDEIPDLFTLLKEIDVKLWQVQIVEDIGNAQDNPKLALTLENVYRLTKYIAEFRKQKDMRVILGDNIGYFVSFEPMLRDQPFTGCAAGRFALGIESNGNIRGCLSIISTPETVEGNVRERSLIEIWNDPELFKLYRQRTVEKLTGFCAQCEYRNLCRAGCSSLAHSLTGGFYDNPFCLHRYELENNLI